MELYQLQDEVTILKQMIDRKCKRYTNLCTLDVDGLNELWINDDLLNDVRCAFLPLMREMLDIAKMPRLNFDFIDEETRITDNISIVSLRDTKFFMKMEEYGRETDWILHEYFVGIHLENFITFATVLGAYSCTPYVENVSRACQYAGSPTENVNFVLYQYIDGETLYDTIDNKNLTAQETWNIVKIVWESLKEMNSRNGFIHQDMHFSNIMIIDLGDVFTIEVGSKTFETRYLPKIIDYGRSAIKVEGRIFSPSDLFLKLPAHSGTYDLIYLLRSFTVVYDDYSGIVGFKQTSRRDALLYHLLSLEDDELLQIYEYYDRKYSSQNKVFSQNRASSTTVVQAERKQTSLFPKCRFMHDPDETYSAMYRRKVDYYHDERELDKIRYSNLRVALLRKHVNINNLNRYLDLFIKNNFYVKDNEEYRFIISTFLHHYSEKKDDSLLDKILIYNDIASSNPDIITIDVLDRLNKE